MSLRMYDLTAFGDTIKEAKARVGVISNRIDALGASYAQRHEFLEELDFVKPSKRDASIQSL